jgi:hypothetical protein
MYILNRETLIRSGPLSTSGCSGTPAWSPLMPFPEVELRTIPESIVSGGSTTLSWEAMNGASCTIEPDIGAVDTRGSIAVAPTQTTTYTITAKGAHGTATSAVTVTVTAP